MAIKDKINVKAHISLASKVFLASALILSFFSAACSTGPSKEDQRGELHYRLGTAHLRKGNYPLALKELRRAQKLSPNHTGVANNLGLSYYARGKFKLAEAQFRRALKIDSGYSDARNNLGRTLIELGRVDEAVLELKKAEADLEYGDPGRTMSNLGYAYFKSGRVGLARNTLIKALELNRQNCFAKFYLGRSVYRQSDFKVASETFDQIIDSCMDNSYASSYYFAGSSYFRLGDREKSVARLEEFLEKFPTNTHAAEAKELLRKLKRD